MKRVCLMLASLCGFAGSALAQEVVYKYDADTINSSVKCELSQVAKLYGRGAEPSRMQAFVTITGEESRSRKVGGSFGIHFLSGGAQYETKTSRMRSTRGKRNIHVDNAVNCRKSFVVDVGVLSCFQEQRGAFFGDGQQISCSQTASATASASAGAKLQAWVIDAAASGDLSITRSWKIDVVAPPDK